MNELINQERKKGKYQKRKKRKRSMKKGNKERQEDRQTEKRGIYILKYIIIIYIIYDLKLPLLEEKYL